MPIKTEEEIRMEKILDQLDLDRLEQDRQVIDMDGWSEKKRKNRWSYRRPELGLTRTHLDDIVSTPLEEEDA